MTKPKNKVGSELDNAKRELFCKLYTQHGELFGNGTRAYAEAYNINLEEKGQYKVAMASASRLLSNVKICERINELLEEGGLNDQFVDKQTLFMITQHSDMSAKKGGIDIYNRIKGRYEKDNAQKERPQPIINLINQIDGQTKDLVEE